MRRELRGNEARVARKRSAADVVNPDDNDGDRDVVLDDNVPEQRKRK